LNIDRIPKTMRAIIYRGVNDLRLETLPVPRISATELLVKVAACGVCPTDIKKIHYGTVPPPRVFGHETAGTIVKVGARVRGFCVGERVGLHHHVPCMDCHACRHRAFAQCPQYKYLTGITAGFEPAGGGYAEYVRVMSFVLPGVIKIPPKNTFQEGAMQEPVNTILKGVNKLSLLPGDTVMVAGQGPIGLMFTRLLALRGMKVLATDLMESRLKLARKWGAHWTMNPAMGRARHSVRAALDGRAHCPSGRTSVRASSPTPQSAIRIPHSLDGAVICVPSDAAVAQARELVRGGGQILLFAHTRRGVDTPTDLSSVCVDEKDLLGSYSSDYTLQKEVARLVFSRKLDVRQIISHQFPLEQTAAAIELAAHPTPNSLKIMVVHEL
jgi:L-iditol 2-dehydrogenase